MDTSALCVTTQRRLDRHEAGGYWFRLSEYSDMAELHTACARCFPEERVPQFRFREWSDIPDELVREDWLSPNLFEALDALSEIDEDNQKYFLYWCRQNGYDIATDDMAELVARYLSLYGEYSEPAEEPPDEYDSWYNMRRYTTEIFTDNDN